MELKGTWEIAGPGPGWYRLRFPAPADAAGHPFLEFAGVDFSAEVWLNGEYLGYHEGEFEPFSFPVTLQAENLLAVRVAAPDGAPGAAIVRPVSLLFRPQLHVSALAVTPYLADDSRQADLVVQVTVANDTDRPITEPLRILVAPHNFAGGGIRHPLIVTFPPGRSEHTFTVTLKRPELWWSRELGAPNLYKAMVLIGGEAVPQAETVFGVREFRQGDDGSLWLNGQRLSGPSALVQAARVEQAEYYRRCDEEGILVTQALPFPWREEPDGLLLQRAGCLVRAAVRQVYNHPSVVTYAAPEQLVPALRRAVAAVDRTRPVIATHI